MTAAALGAASDTVAIKLNGAGGVATTVVNLDVTSGTSGYETMNVNSGGGGHNALVLNTNATSTSTIVVTGAQNLLILGDALNIADLHTFNGSAATGDLGREFQWYRPCGCHRRQRQRHLPLLHPRWGNVRQHLQRQWRRWYQHPGP